MNTINSRKIINCFFSLVSILSVSILLNACTESDEDIEAKRRAERREQIWALIKPISLFHACKEIEGLRDTLFSKEQLQDSTINWLVDLEYIQFPYGEVSKNKFDSLFKIKNYDKMPMLPLEISKDEMVFDYYDSDNAYKKATFWLDVMEDKASFVQVTFTNGVFNRFDEFIRRGNINPYYQITYPAKKKEVMIFIGLGKYPYPRRLEKYPVNFSAQEKELLKDFFDTVKFDLPSHLAWTDTLSTYKKWNEKTLLRLIKKHSPNKKVEVVKVVTTIPMFIPNGLQRIVDEEKFQLKYAKSQYTYSLRETVQNDSIIIPLEWFVTVLCFEPKGNLKTY